MQSLQAEDCSCTLQAFSCIVKKQLIACNQNKGVAMDFPIQTLSQLRPILQGFRKENGLTQAALAARIGITQQSYAELEANPASVSVERLFKVLNLLNVDLVLKSSNHQDGATIEQSTQKESW